jgi:hypothetical protein
MLLFSRRYLAPKRTTVKNSLYAIFGFLTVLPTIISSAQVFNDFEGGTVGGQWGFRQPTFSGSTSPNLQPQSTPNTNNIMQVTQGFDINSTRVGEVRFNFLDSSPNRWLRLTTAGATGVPNPQIPLDGIISFDVYSVFPVELALGVRETLGNGPLGANGGTAGTIEWLGADRATASATTAPGGKLIPAGSWQTVTFDFTSEPVFAFTGDGTLIGFWGVLESIAITSQGDTDQHLYFDNFQFTPVPEPSSVVLVLVAGVCAFAVLRRRS